MYHTAAPRFPSNVGQVGYTSSLAAISYPALKLPKRSHPLSRCPCRIPLQLEMEADSPDGVEMNMADG